MSLPAPGLLVSNAVKRRGVLAKLWHPFLHIAQACFGSIESRPGIRALGIGTLQNVAPQGFCNRAGLAVLALPLLSRALGTVAQEKQPALLFGDVLAVGRSHFELEVLLTALVVATCRHRIVFSSSLTIILNNSVETSQTSPQAMTLSSSLSTPIFWVTPCHRSTVSKVITRRPPAQSCMYDRLAP